VSLVYSQWAGAAFCLEGSLPTHTGLKVKLYSQADLELRISALEDVIGVSVFWTKIRDFIE